MKKNAICKDGIFTDIRYPFLYKTHMVLAFSPTEKVSLSVPSSPFIMISLSLIPVHPRSEIPVSSP